MPTPNPRTNVTLSPSLDLLVIRLAAMQRVSKSQVLRELLEAAEPALQRAVTLMEAASKATEGVRAGLRDSLTRAQDKAEAELAVHLHGLDSITKDLVDQAQEVRGKRPRASHKQSAPPVATAIAAATGGGALFGLSTPVPVTRGSGHPGEGKRKGLPVVPSVPYSGLTPAGQRVLMGAGEYFDKAGVLRSVKGSKRGRV